ncbi:unnamed protein product, partial [Bubo scandiacus]
GWSPGHRGKLWSPHCRVGGDSNGDGGEEQANEPSAVGRTVVWRWWVPGVLQI